MKSPRWKRLIPKKSTLPLQNPQESNSDESATLSFAPAEISMLLHISSIVTFVSSSAPTFDNLNCLEFHFFESLLPILRCPCAAATDLRHRPFAAQLPSRRCFRSANSRTTCAAKGVLQHVISDQCLLRALNRRACAIAPCFKCPRRQRTHAFFFCFCLPRWQQPRRPLTSSG